MAGSRKRLVLLFATVGLIECPCTNDLGWGCSGSLCYNIYTCYKPFQDARDSCGLGFGLATIFSPDERDIFESYVNSVMTTDNLFWIGGTRLDSNSEFTWVNHSTAPFPLQVTSGLASDLCLIYRANPNNDFKSEPCSSFHNFICRNGTGVFPSSISTSLNLPSSTTPLTTTEAIHSTVEPSETTPTLEITTDNLPSTVNDLSTGQPISSQTFHETSTEQPTSYHELATGQPTSSQTTFDETSTEQPTSHHELSTGQLTSSQTTFDETSTEQRTSHHELSTATTTTGESTKKSKLCECCFRRNYQNRTSSKTGVDRNDRLVVVKPRKLQTADDTRPSARGIGASAIILLVSGFVAIVVLDASKLLRDVLQMFDNIRGMKERNKPSGRRRLV